MKMQLKSKVIKRLRAIAVGGTMAISTLAAPFAMTPMTVSAADTDNYAKLLQYTMYFYDANMCGPDAEEHSALDWRGDCHASDEVPGGFHDAGDHAMFGLPQGYTASTLGWGYYEFKESYDSLGLTSHFKTISDHFCDFFKKSTKLSGNDVSNFCYQKGDGDADHSYWGPPETQDGNRKMFWTNSTASDIAAEYAAALALNYLNFGNEEDLTYAKALVNYANRTNSCATDGPNDFYKSEACNDDIAWAAGWVYIATKDNTYKSIMDSKIPQYLGYTHCWNNVGIGAHCVRAHITGDWSSVTDYISKNAANSSNYFFQDMWGSARHNTTMQLCALVATKNSSADFSSWAKGQMSYVLGQNPKNTCYVVGFSSNAAKYPHHRASSGFTNWDQFNAAKAGDGTYGGGGHVLVGALVGGPTDAGGSYQDRVDDYKANEVASDYNAGIVGAAAGLYSIYKTGSVDNSIVGVGNVDVTPKQTTTTTTTTTTIMTTTTTTTTRATDPPRTTTTTTTTTTVTAPPVKTLRGDVDGNGTIAIADVVLLARYVSQDGTLDRNAVNLQNADVKQDGQYNAEDISMLARYLANIIGYYEMG